MRTTRKAYAKLNSLSDQFRLFNDYIQKHPDGLLVKNSLVYQKLLRSMLKMQQELLDDTLI